MNEAKSFAPDRSKSRAMRLSWGNAHSPPAMKNNSIASESSVKAEFPIAMEIKTARTLMDSGNAKQEAPANRMA